MRYIKAEDLFKLMDDIEKDIPPVPWKNQFANYIKAFRKMARNLIIDDEDKKNGRR